MGDKLLKNEDKLIYLFSRLEIGEAGLKEIKKSLSKPLDFKRLKDIAAKQQVYQFLYYSLNELGLNALIPAQILDETKSAYYANIARNFALEREALLLSEKAKAKGASLIPFRGISMIYGVYNNPGLRQMADIDILIKPEDSNTIKNILLEMGYREYLSEGHSMDDGLITSFSKKISRNLTIFIEPHTAIASPRPYKIKFPHLWERSIEVNIANKKILILSKEDMILSISLHIRRHARQLALKSIVDVAEILNAAKNTLDWGYIIKYARDNSMISSLYLSLYLAQELLGATAPPDTMNLVKPNRIKNFLIRMAINRYNFFYLRTWRGAMVRFLIFDTFKDFIYYLWRIVFLKIIFKIKPAATIPKNKSETIKK